LNKLSCFWNVFQHFQNKFKAKVFFTHA
jgi:hypothetical protein